MAASSDSSPARTNGQLATSPRTTTGSVAIKMLSGSSRGPMPETSRTVLGMSSMQALAPLDQRAKVREGCDGHVRRQQVPRFVQAFQRVAAERGEALFVEGVEAREPLL